MFLSREPTPLPQLADIVLQGVEKRFRGSNGTTIAALARTDLAVRRKEFVSIIGPSGCGKSTLLRIVAGLVAPSSGTVVVGGRVVTEPNADIGIVFQSSVLLPWRTVLQNVMLQAQIRKLDRRGYEEKARLLLRLTGLEQFEGSYPFQLSGGMQQRVSICRALIHDPMLLLMDEPFGALDALTRDQMSIELQRIWMERSKTVLFVTHSIPEAVFLSDRVVVMGARPGTIKEIVEVPLGRPRTLSTMDGGAFRELTRHLRAVLDQTSQPMAGQSLHDQEIGRDATLYRAD